MHALVAPPCLHECNRENPDIRAPKIGEFLLQSFSSTTYLFDCGKDPDALCHAHGESLCRACKVLQGVCDIGTGAGTIMSEKLNKTVVAGDHIGNTPEAKSHAIEQNPDQPVIGMNPEETQQNELLEQWTWRIVQDLRNCLQVISGHGEMLCPTMGEDELRWHKDEIQKAVSQAGELASRLQVLAETGLQMLKEANPGSPNCGGGPQAKASSEMPSSTQASQCGHACKLLSSPGRTVFWRRVPSLREPLCVGFLDQFKPGGSSGLQGARK